jgi:hypothetical protein
MIPPEMFEKNFHVAFVKHKEFLIGTITNVLQYYDFIGIARCSKSEYETEAKVIVDRIFLRTQEERDGLESHLPFRRILRSVMAASFTISLAGSEERYDEAARIIANIYRLSLWIYPVTPAEEKNASLRVDKETRPC